MRGATRGTAPAPVPTRRAVSTSYKVGELDLRFDIVLTSGGGGALSPSRPTDRAADGAGGGWRVPPHNHMAHMWVSPRVSPSLEQASSALTASLTKSLSGPGAWRMVGSGTGGHAARRRAGVRGAASHVRDRRGGRRCGASALRPVVGGLGSWGCRSRGGWGGGGSHAGPQPE